MNWSYESAIDKVAQMFPHCETLVVDGCHEYVVGTVETDAGEIEASFRLTFAEPGIKTGEVTDIAVTRGPAFCGTVSRGDQPCEVSRPTRNYVPFTLVRVTGGARNATIGLVGDYEVCVSADTLISGEGLPYAN